MRVWPFGMALLMVSNLVKCEDEEVDSDYETLKLRVDQALNDKKHGQLTTAFEVRSSSFEAKLAHIPGVGEDRGPRFYEYHSQSSKDDDDDLADFSKSFSETHSKSGDNHSDEASSANTRENKKKRRTWRDCTPCALDMVRKHTNIGIKWICGAYQRARRTFKSECLMHYRNCQDGTMFVKVSEHRCTNDGYHGKHWFYIYKV